MFGIAAFPQPVKYRNPADPVMPWHTQVYSKNMELIL